MKGIVRHLIAGMQDASTAASRGSALLVVLGMVSFMLFSGLAFSVYMRQSRLPTSFVRRTVLTRHLAKAALAEAITEIDYSIGNQPHPNFYVASRGDNNTEEGTEQSYLNFWSHRVFLGTGVKTKTTFNDYEKADGMINGFVPKYEDPEDTVPTLTLEGLAYVPPKLLNEVRYYSQRTPTAKWHAFNFDSGRYAYTAIDVSDYFDVHRVFADVPRASCGSQRITFAHLFDTLQANEESDGDVSIDKAAAGDGAGDWDSKFMLKYRIYDIEEQGSGGEAKDTGYWPLVSLADFNIAWGDKTWKFGGKDCENPFRAYLEANGNPATIYSTDPTKQEYYRRMTFVTDGWYSGRAKNTVEVTDGNQSTSVKKLDLTGTQPFTASDLDQENSSISFDSVVSKNSEVITRLKEHISLLGLAQLWDYLDADSVPISLAVPTLERTPMIAGIGLSQMPSLKFSSSHSGTRKSSDKTRKEPYQGQQAEWACEEYEYKMQFSAEGGGTSIRGNVLLVYPFRKHGTGTWKDRDRKSDDKDPTDFTVDGHIKLFFSTSGQNVMLRPQGGNDALHVDKSTISTKGFNDSVISVPFTATGCTVPFNENGTANGDFVQAIPVQGELNGLGGTTIAKVTYEWPVKWDHDGKEETPMVETGIDPESDPNQYLKKDTAECSFMSLKADGSLDADTCKNSLFENLKKTVANAVKWKVNAAVWARVANGDKTVDLVPAGSLDDLGFNDIRTSKRVMQLNGGNDYPLLRFDVTADGGNDGSIPFSIEGMKNVTYKLSMATPMAVVSDPRFNHAPENWYTTSGGNNSGDEALKQAWLDSLSGLVGSTGHDSDMFMYTSDQCVMQSVYELAYLPRLTTLDRKTGSDAHGLAGGDFPIVYEERSSLLTAANKQSAPHYNFMWNTYRCDDDPFDDIGIVSGDTGLKVNPYSDDTRVLLAAFSNTPHDWRVATTNNDNVAGLDAKTFNSKHAWNEYSSDTSGKLCGQTLLDIATAFKNGVKSNNGDWESAFADLGWGSAEDSLCGVTLDQNDSKLYGVDKKFLYGFWHDSFAAQQQLFLIFVRAEPMMMGGGVTGQVPPQLSTRAVALVWRDPTQTTRTISAKSSSGSSVTRRSHRCRVLFYHPLD